MGRARCRGSGRRRGPGAALCALAATCVLACTPHCAARAAQCGMQASTHVAFARALAPSRSARARAAVCGGRCAAAGPARAAAGAAAGMLGPSAEDFVLELDERCRVTVIRQFLPRANADRLLCEVPALCALQLTPVGSRQTAVYFDEPARDYFFTGRRWSMDSNAGMPGAIANVKDEAGAAAGQAFNGAVVNVYDTVNSQIKWHDDGEYSYVH